MPRARTGTVVWSGGLAYARITLVGDQRASLPMPWAQAEKEARERTTLLSAWARELLAAGQADAAERILGRGAAATAGKELDAVRRFVAAIVARKPPVEAAPGTAVTFEDVAKRWVSGELHREHKDHIAAKQSDKDEGRLERHVLPIVGPIAIASFSIEDADRVMRALPAELSPASRRHVAQLVHRVLAIAVSPLRLRAANPLPRGWLPGVGPAKAKVCLWPDEDARLLACVAIPLCWRVSWGFLAREGLRTSEAAALQWSDLDLERGAIVLDENKTSDPRAWALDPGVVRALKAWRALRGDPPPEALVLVDEDGEPIGARLADRFRRHLKKAGVDRPQLTERSAVRLPIRAHDLRATFVTLSLAEGKSESWVGDRTGHRSSIMIQRYRRLARHAAELGLGGLRALVEAIPELAAWETAEETAEQPDNSAMVEPETPIDSIGSPARGRTGMTSLSVDFKSTRVPSVHRETLQSPRKNATERHGTRRALPLRGGSLPFRWRSPAVARAARETWERVAILPAPDRLEAAVRLLGAA